ncbi:MAG: LysM peptidoglycan-binding domain-containing protein, partial [Lachnospiraceae bacterium]|nr:LysM peptidoglycan-binding domain-containing protein [Lachnospiraceae bacterium]
MDKQAINIPVNARTVGNAKHIFEGIYVLYLEDYVHTFIKKLLYDEQEYDDMLGVSVCMYGSSFEKDSQNIMVVSGAVLSEQAEKNNFPKESKLCTALVKLNKDRGIRFEISINGTKVILDDFYIYYDQNEEMQNYLIEWNSRQYEHQTTKTGRRIPTDSAAKLGRLAQAYNKESARVSLVWGAMNVLSLSLVVCVIAYGIISLNSYGKMQSMQESIDYCMTFVSENMEKNNEEAAAAVARQKEQAVEMPTQQPIETPVAQTVQEPVLQQEAEAREPEAQEPETQQPIQSINTDIPQYYVVQPGDTLGNICRNLYGDYSRIEEICELNNLENPDNIL